jgi:peptidoglycan/xylan/chitin deacetylase (PgdA/CDA1 family)
MAEADTGFRFPTSRIPYPDRAGLKVWPNGARMAFLFYASAEEWDWTEDAGGHALDPFPLAKFGEKKLALSMRSAIEFGFNVGLYRTAEVLSDVGMKGTIWTTGNAVEQHREVVEMLANEGHEIGGHGYSEGWPMASMDREGQADAIRRSVELLSSVTGKPPTSWVGPGAAADRDTVELLAEAGFLCHGDFQDDELPYFLHVGERTLVEIPYRMVGNLNDVPLISNYGAFKSVEEAGRHLRESFDAAYELAETHTSVFNFGTHPHVIGRPDPTKTMKSFLEYVAGFDDVWVTTYAEMAEWWQEQFGHLVPVGGGDIDVAALAL